MESDQIQVSHVDLYHKLGKLEGLMQTLTTNITTFQAAISDLHGRIDAVERRQNELERNNSSSFGGIAALSGFAKDFFLPALAVAVAWFIAKSEPGNLPTHQPYHMPSTQHNNGNTK